MDNMLANSTGWPGARTVSCDPAFNQTGSRPEPGPARRGRWRPRTDSGGPYAPQGTTLGIAGNCLRARFGQCLRLLRGITPRETEIPSRPRTHAALTLATQTPEGTRHAQGEAEPLVQSTNRSGTASGPPARRVSAHPRDATVCRLARLGGMWASAGRAAPGWRAGRVAGESSGQRGAGACADVGHRSERSLVQARCAAQDREIDRATRFG